MGTGASFQPLTVISASGTLTSETHATAVGQRFYKVKIFEQ